MIDYPSLCAHPNFVDQVTGAPKYECRTLRDNHMPCGPHALLYVPRGSPDVETEHNKPAPPAGRLLRVSR